jgi:hypothetical protein
MGAEPANVDNRPPAQTDRTFRRFFFAHFHAHYGRLLSSE